MKRKLDARLDALEMKSALAATTKLAAAREEELRSALATKGRELTALQEASAKARESAAADLEAADAKVRALEDAIREKDMRLEDEARGSANLLVAVRSTALEKDEVQKALDAAREDARLAHEQMDNLTRHAADLRVRLDRALDHSIKTDEENVRLKAALDNLDAVVNGRSPP